MRTTLTKLQLFICLIVFVICSLQWKMKYLDKTLAAVNARIVGSREFHGNDPILVPRLDSSYIEQSDVPEIKVDTVDCNKIFSGDQNEIAKAETYQNQNIGIHRNNINTDIMNCSNVVDRYLKKPVNAEDEEFPIAFSILMYKDPEMTERLLRAIYRPQNFYCIHVDAKSSEQVYDYVSSVCDCFDNMFVSPQRIDVVWGRNNVLEAEIVCLESLWQYSWKYFINLTGQEFPLRTNSEIVKILQLLNGANVVSSSAKRARRLKGRFEYVHENGRKTGRTKNPFTRNITMGKSAVHIAASRDFVDFILHNQTALEFHEWLKDTEMSEESFFASLNISPQLGVPGAFTGRAEWTDENGINPILMRYKNWADHHKPCAGKYVRSICILGVGDLQRLGLSKQLFANKFHYDFHPLAYDCLEQNLFQKVMLEVQGQSSFNDSYYRHLEVVKNHL